MFIQEKIYKVILCFILGLAIHGHLSSQKIKFDHYGLEQGFYASKVFSIDKGQDGYLWIGTENGVYRFDGHQFKGYFFDPNDSNTFDGNYINKVSLDKHNRLWVVSNVNSINIFDIKSNRVIRYQDPSLGIISGDFRVFNLVYVESRDETWINTDIGLFYSKGDTIHFKKYIIDDIQTTNDNTYITIDDKNNMWFVNAFGLHFHNTKTCQSKSILNPFNKSKAFDGNDFVTLQLEGDSIAWIGGWSTGLYRYNIKNETWKRYLWVSLDKMGNMVSNMYQDKINTNLLWLATSAGLQVFNKNTEKFTSYYTDNIYDPYGITGDCYAFKYTDSEGLWIGTRKGLHKVDPLVQFFENKALSGIEKYEFPYPNAISFEKNNGVDSIVWFVLPYNETVKFDLVNKKILPIPDVLRPYCTGKIEPLFTYIDSKNRLWISSYSMGLVGYDLNLKKLIKPLLENGQKLSAYIIREDSKGRMWFGSHRGLYHLNDNSLVRDNKLATYFEKIGAYSYLFYFEIDRKDNIWIIPRLMGKHHQVILKYNLNNKEVVKYDTTTNNELIKLNHLEDIKVYDDDKIILTSSFGLAIGRIFNHKIKFNYHRLLNGHPINSTQNIGEDKDNIYLNSDLGIIRYNKKKENLHLISSNNSNLGEGTAPYFAYSKASNKIYIGQPGYFQTISSQVDRKKIPFDLQLTALTVNDSVYSDLPKSGSTIKFKHDQNSLKLMFSCFNFTNANETLYEYRLNDSKKWNQATNNALNFTRMPSGKHILFVRSSNWYTLPSDQVFVLNIEILYPWYQTWWFQGLVLAIIIGGIFSIFKYRELQRERIEKLRRSIARDLHDDMGSNLSHIKMLSEKEAMNPKHSLSFNVIASKAGEVMNSMSEIIWTLNPKFETLEALFSKIQEFAIDTLEPQNIEVHFDIDYFQTSMKLSPDDRRHFYLIFKEAINNSMKYSKAKNVTLSLRQNSNRIEAKISDDGIGFDQDIIKKGNGLLNMAERAKLLGGQLVIDTSPKGTEIKFTLKLKWL